MSMSFGLDPAIDKNEAIKLIRSAFDQGVTFFDTAEPMGLSLTKICSVKP